jgi:CelD/BcsL family acetyltransferase involved in cellulose biosynthesis
MTRRRKPLSPTTPRIWRRISGHSDNRKPYRPGVIATGRIMATVIPGSSQSNRDRAKLVALRRLGTVEDCVKVVEFLATDLSDYVTGAVIPAAWCADSQRPAFSVALHFEFDCRYGNRTLPLHPPAADADGAKRQRLLTPETAVARDTRKGIH